MSYVSDVSNTLVINDVTDIRSLGINATGYEERDWEAEPFGANGFAVPLNLPLIPQSEWADRIEEIEKSGGMLSVMSRKAGVKTKFQSSTNYCWTHGPTLATEIIEVKQGRPYVELSATSVAAPLTGYRNVGGWGTKALAYIVEHGIAPVANWPANAIDRRYATRETDEARKSHKITEWADVEPRNFAAVMTCLLMGIPVPVAFNYWRHLVCAVDPVALPNGQFGIRIWNSWGEAWGDKGFAVLTGNKAIPDEAVAPMVALA